MGYLDPAGVCCELLKGNEMVLGSQSRRFAVTV